MTLFNSRRDFIRSLAIGGTALALGDVTELLASEDLIKITLLHTNDMHSHIDPFPDNDPKYPGMGGMSRLSAIVKQIKEKEKNVLLFDAGDVFQGSPYFNFYGGEVEYKVMSQIGYDAVNIGNHDFDNGLEGLDKQLVHAKFPLLSANYDFSKTILNGKTKPYKVFDKGGIRIGVFGLGIEFKGLVDKKNYGNTIYNNPLVTAAVTTHLLKYEYKCDLIIAISHLGLSYDDKKVSDVVLAKESKNIDIIIGGHSHTMLDPAWRQRNSDFKEVLITQVGWAGVKLGRIDCYFSGQKKKKKNIIASTINNFKNQV